MMADFSTVCVFLSLLLSLCPQRGCCQDYQLIDLRSPGVTCSMDSIYSNSGYGTSLNCTGAINGNTTAKWSPTKYQNPNCVYTNEGAGEHYWQVDLGKTHNIHKIVIYPETIWNYMSGITVSVDNTQVFQFTSSPDNQQVITPDSPLMGRVIKLSKSGYVTLCELQVYDCVSDRYGARCQETCSAGCQSDTCDSITGDCTCRTGWSPPQCQECDTGWAGDNCDECVAGRYGTNCQQSCGAGCSTTTCDKDSGTCTCRTGWATPRCNVCVAGRYGTNCLQYCGAGCSTTTCNKDSGACTCRTGWATPRCDECLAGRYGTNCLQYCGAGCSTTSCNKDSGACTCRTGWATPRCDECSDGYYHNTTALGSSACQKCGDGCVTTSCDDVTGICTCRPGWKEPTCQGCAPGQFGDDCQHTCSVGCQNICDLNTGRCTCRQGWDGRTCETCATDYYNKSESGNPIPWDCIPCGSGCSDTCNGQSGYCTCRTGWEPPFCDQVCSPGHYSPNLGCKACGAGCEDVTSCDTLSGSCSCRTGWEPPTCHVCKTKLWGDNCTMACGDCAGDGSCNRITGDCTFGSSGQESDSNTGAIVGSVVGVGLFFLGICVLVGALLIIRSRRSRQPARTEEQHENNISTAQEKETSIDFASAVDKSRGSMTEEGDGSDNYAKLASYENSDDIKPYTSLQTNQPSTHGPHTLSTTAKDIGVYEIPDVEYENTRKK